MAGSSFKFISLNICSNSNTLGGLQYILQNSKPDLVFLQEVAITQEGLDKFLLPLGYLGICNNIEGGVLRGGTAVVWSSRECDVKVSTLQECRVQKVICRGRTLLNIYAHSGAPGAQGRKELFGNLVLTECKSGTVPLLAGDFNCIINILDTELNPDRKICQPLKDLVRIFSYADLFDEVRPVPDCGRFTWFRRGFPSSRLDRFYAPREFIEGLTSVTHFPTLSDHMGLEVVWGDFPGVVGSTQHKRARKGSYWKMNVRILSEDNYLKGFKALWSSLLKQEGSYKGVAEWWDLLCKPEIKNFSLDYSKKRAKLRKGYINYLYFTLGKAYSQRDWLIIAKTQAKLSEMQLEDSKGLIIRSKNKWGVEFERASLYHANKEKKNGDSTNIASLKKVLHCKQGVIDGHSNMPKKVKITKVEGVLKDWDHIEEEVLGFWHPLFSGFHGTNGVNTGKTFVQDKTYLRELLSRLGKLNSISKGKLEVPVTLEELWTAVKKCKGHKSPGLDGIPYEFYKQMFPVIGVKLLEVLQNILDGDKLPQSQRDGVTRLTPKVNTLPAADEFRPITLLCCDYKLLSKVLVARVVPVLDQVILSRQLCSVPGANILFGVSSLLSCFAWAELKGVPLASLKLDQWKAFDRVYIPFLLQVLEAMNFGESFIKWIRMFHCDITTCFILSKLSRPIDLIFSIRQGDPIAMILYIIFVEPLLLHLEAKVGGLFIGRSNNISACFADDIQLLINKVSQFGVVDDCFAQFECTSGAVLCRKKSKADVMGFGEWQGVTRWPLPWLKSVEFQKVFGVLFYRCYQDTIRNNWEGCLAKFKGVLISWGSRLLDTLWQRVTVLHTFAYSRVWYLAQVLPLPKGFCERFEQEARIFLWWVGGLSRFRGKVVS